MFSIIKVLQLGAVIGMAGPLSYAVPGQAQPVLVGSNCNFTQLGVSAAAQPLKSTGRVGLYMQESGWIALTNDQRGAIGQAMGAVGPGEVEMATIQPVGWNANWFGVNFNVLWVAQGFSPASAPSGTFQSSTAVGPMGYAPHEFNVNLDFTSPAWQAEYYDLVTVVKTPQPNEFNVPNQTYVTNIAPIFAPNSNDVQDAAGQWGIELAATVPGNDTSIWIAQGSNFGTNPAVRPIRKAALAGGALAIDAPPGYYLYAHADQAHPTYRDYVREEISWAYLHGLRATLILSPYSDDVNFLSDVQSMVSDLVAHNAIPTEWVVENYDCVHNPGVQTADLLQNGELDPNSLAGAALWLAQNAPVRKALGGEVAENLVPAGM